MPFKKQTNKQHTYTSRVECKPAWRDNHSLTNVESNRIFATLFVYTKIPDLSQMNLHNVSFQLFPVNCACSEPIICKQTLLINIFDNFRPQNVCKFD